MIDIISKLPQEFLNNMKHILKDKDYASFLNSFNEKEQKAIRVNNNKIDTEKFLSLYNEKIEKVPYFENAFYVDKEKLGVSVLHQIGAFYSQEPSSMIPVACLQDFNLKGKRVLDLCSSPGGKATQIASLVGEDGLIVCNEIISSRSKVLFSNIERLGLKNTIILNETPKRIAEHFKGFFDVVIVDAPCSGEGMFRKDEMAIKEWHKDLPLINSERQKKILLDAIKCLKYDGILLYSTCTYNLLENESNVDFLIKNNMEQLDVSNKVKPYICYEYIKEKTVRCLPFKTRGEGQFCAVLKNKNQNNENCLADKKCVIYKDKIINEFLQKYFNFNQEKNLELIENKINILPSNYCNTNGLNVLSKGVILGEIVKNRVEPHHQLFSAYGKNSRIQINYDINDENIKKYLRGEEIFEDLPNGFGTILCENICVGGFKSVNGTLKNYYPKGIRIVIK